MKILIIHPKDSSTDFLCASYRDLDCTVINTRVSSSELKSNIKNHDLIVMMGHGDDYGLYGFGDYIINSKYVYLLREKKVFCMWCNSDNFVKKYGLIGFYSGMIISDSIEANLFYVNATDKEIDESNINLAKL